MYYSSRLRGVIARVTCGKASHKSQSNLMHSDCRAKSYIATIPTLQIATGHIVVIELSINQQNSKFKK